jgi:hypothetical protein
MEGHPMPDEMRCMGDAHMGQVFPIAEFRQDDKCDWIHTGTPEHYATDGRLVTDDRRGIPIGPTVLKEPK